MLSELKRTPPRVPARMSIVLAVVAIATLGAPLVSLSQRTVPADRDPFPGQDDNSRAGVLAPRPVDGWEGEQPPSLLDAAPGQDRPAWRAPSDTRESRLAPQRAGDEPSRPLSQGHEQAGQTAKPQQTEFLPPLSAAEAKLVKALDEPTKLEFDKATLKEVVEYLADLHELPILVDEKNLDESGISPEARVSFRINNATLRSALKFVLARLGLEFTICNDVLLITTPEIAAATHVTRLYPVSDLFVMPANYTPALDWSVAGDASSNPVLAEVKKLIVESVGGEGAWIDGGGSGRISWSPSAQALIVVQTRDAHDQVLSLLRSMREARKIASGPTIQLQPATSYFQPGTTPTFELPNPPGGYVRRPGQLRSNDEGAPRRSTEPERIGPTEEDRYDPAAEHPGWRRTGPFDDDH